VEATINKRENEAASQHWGHLRLPPFPQVAVRVLQLINDEHVHLHHLCNLISSDPAFSSEVLTVANSLLYAPRFPASTIMQAVAVLGARHLQGMCLTVAARGYLGKSMNHPAIRDVWHHNLACAIIAGKLAAAGQRDKEIAYTFGILHDVGRFALSMIQPKEYASLLVTHHGTPDSILKSERELFGCDHCEAGHRLIAGWKLSHDFEAVAAEHHSPRQADGSWAMIELIKLSCKMADTAGFPSFKGCEVTPYPDLLNELPARERDLFHPEVETLAAEVAASIHAVESV